MEIDRYIREHGKRVYGLCRHLCGNAADADDLYQETWLRAMKGLAKFDPSLDFEPWITFTIPSIAQDTISRNRDTRYRPRPGNMGGASSEQGRSLWRISTGVSRLTQEEDGTYMKKTVIVLALTLAFTFTMSGCDNISMNYIIENKPNVTGVVEEVHDGYVIMHSETAEGYPNGSEWSISLDAENADSYTNLVVGDEIVVYYDGMAMETDPLQVGTVYAITLKTPADRAVNDQA